MSLTINRTDRDALYDGLMTDLTAIGDIFTNLHNDEPIPAKRLRRRFEIELRLLDDLGWEKEPDQERFELTMPARELRPIIERIYWSAVGSLADHPDELVDEAVYALTNATSACPEVLARLAEDDLFDPEAWQGADLAGSEVTSE
jgi:hypothetical protein